MNVLALYAAALTGALATTLATVPLWRAWAARTGLVDDPGHRKIHAVPVPLAGGLAVLTGLLLPVLAGVLLLQVWPGLGGSSLLAYGLERREIQILAIFLGAIGMTALGWLDD